MITGSRILTTDVDTAVRGWLVLSADGFRMPHILRLVDVRYGGDVTRDDAHDALNHAGKELHQEIASLPGEQLAAFLEQCDDADSATELLERVQTYWPRPRLVGIDWTVVGKSRETAKVSKAAQDEDWDLKPGDQVMLAGDSFADVHGTVLEDLDRHWVVQLFWGVWDR